MSQVAHTSRVRDVFPPVVVALALVSVVTAATYLRDLIGAALPNATTSEFAASHIATGIVFAGAGILVSMAMQRIAHGEPIFPQLVRVLSNEDAEASGARLSAQLTSALRALDAHSKSAGTFAESLSEGQSRLQLAKDAARASSVLKFLASENEKMQRANAAYQRQLVESTRQLKVLQQELVLVREENERDPLTRAHSRRHFDRTLADAISTAHEEKSDLCLVMIDIDRFKRVNDTFGHLVGDDLLKRFAGVFLQSVKGKDCVARFGGEEFAIIMPATSLQGACAVAEQIRSKLEGMKWKTEGDGKLIGSVTASFGIAQMQQGDAPQDLTGRADAKLYDSKNGGRNRVTC